MNLPSGKDVLTRVEIVDSQGTGWCDVLNRGDEAMLGYVRCEGLNILRPDMPENWRVVPSPEDVRSSDTPTQKSPSSPTVTDTKAGPAIKPGKTKPQMSAPQ